LKSGGVALFLAQRVEQAFRIEMCGPRADTHQTSGARDLDAVAKANAGLLSTDGSRQRMALALPVVRRERNVGSSRRGFCSRGEERLYRCLDKLLEHKTALFDYLRQRWQDLFGADTAYLLAHYFVFERSGRAVHDEYVRFGWWISPQFFKSRSLVFGSPILAFPRLGFSWHSDMIVHITSIAVPVFTSYLGHKNFSLCKKQADSQI
jgi:hypothetical protein